MDRAFLGTILQVDIGVLCHQLGTKGSQEAGEQLMLEDETLCCPRVVKVEHAPSRGLWGLCLGLYQSFPNAYYRCCFDNCWL